MFKFLNNEKKEKTELKEINTKLSTLENQLNRLIIGKSGNFTVTHPEFMRFYNKIKSEAEKSGWLGYEILLSLRCANSLQHEVLYPDYETGYWYPVGHTTNDIPISFCDIPTDFVVKSYMHGCFEKLGEF